MPYADPEESKAYQRAYRLLYKAANREKLRADAKAYYESNRDKILTKNKEYRVVNREKIRTREKKYQATSRAKTQRLKRYYGITLEEFSKLRDSQNNRCAICLKPFLKTPSVDHCHRTKVIRGLLCNACNLGLGMFENSPISLTAAAKYLQK